MKTMLRIDSTPGQKNLHCAMAPALPQRKKTLLTDIAFATACNVAR